MFMNGGVRKILAMFILNDAMVIFTEWRNDNNNGMTLNISNPSRFLWNLAFEATTRDYNLTSNIMLQSFSKHGAK